MRAKRESQSRDWKGIDRVIIEYCCYKDSLMGRPTAQSKGCRVIRVTSEHDQTTKQGLSWLLEEIRGIPRNIPILLWGSIPCTGGSPYTRLNLKQYPDTFPARLRMIRAEWRKIFHNFMCVRDVVIPRGGYWTLE